MADSQPNWVGFPGNHVKLTTDDEISDFAKAHALATQKAREFCDDPMMLAWHQGKTGKSYPDAECGHKDKPAWILYAESRGGDLVIDINEGAYIFIFLTLF